MNLTAELGDFDNSQPTKTPHGAVVARVLVSSEWIINERLPPEFQSNPLQSLDSSLSPYLQVCSFLRDHRT